MTCHQKVKFGLLQTKYLISGEECEEIEALLRGWSDRAAAAKVLQIVEGLVRSSENHARQYSREAREKAQIQHKYEIQLESCEVRNRVKILVSFLICIKI